MWHFKNWTGLIHRHAGEQETRGCAGGSWLRPLRTGRRRARRRPFGPEWLEDRVALSTFPANPTADNGDDDSPTPGSLRAAILAANLDQVADTIDFSIGTGAQTI